MEQGFARDKLEVEIRKSFPGFQMDLKFQAGGGITGILGPSGCGKSMTLKSIAGIVMPDAGHIALSGRILYDSASRICLRPQLRRVGYLFQDYALFPNMTVEENIGVGISQNWFGGRAEARRTMVAEMMRRFQVEDLKDRYPSQLSGGQKQRTALARLLAYEPQALLLDEPFSAMDTYLREGLRLELAKTLREYEGVTVLVTHDRDEAFQLCDHLILMDRGHVIAEGETRQVFEHPGNCLAARMTGCKNLSRILRIGERRIRALDWGGLEFDTAEPVGDEIQSVGIRAHDFIPLSDAQAEAWKGELGANRIPVGQAAVTEMPFEWYVTLSNGLWWKTEKSLTVHDMQGILPEWLRIPPEALILLTGEPEK